MSDWGRESILVFSKSGNLIKKVGREGRGPGEFLKVRNISIANNKLMAFDIELLRLSVFTITKEDIYYKTEVLLSPLDLQDKYKSLSMRPAWLFAVNKNSYLIRYNIGFAPGTGELDRRQKLVYFKIGKDFQNILLTFQSKQWFVNDEGTSISVRPLPFGREPILDVTEDGLVYLGWTGDNIIKVYNLKGEVVNKISFPYSLIELSRQVLKEKLSKYDSRFKNDIKNATPKTWPVFSWFEVDSKGRLWVALNVDDPYIFSLRVFSKEGKLLGQTSLPKSVELQAIDSGYAYGVNENEKGMQSVVRYKIKGLQ